MNYLEENKRSLKNRACCKKLVEKSLIKEMIKERKKHVLPDHIKSLDGTKQEADFALLKTVNKLKKKREDAIEKIKKLTTQWQNLTTKELEFRALVESFNDSTIQNKEKVEREKQKIIIMRHHIRAKDTAIAKIRQENQNYTYILNELKNETQAHLIYEDFLIQFAERFDFKAAGEVLKRYAVLVSTREETHLKLETTHQKSLSFKKEYKKFIHQCEDKSLRLSDFLTQQTKKYDEIREQVRNWEGIVCAVVYQMQRFLTEINGTRDALEQVLCLLLVRLNPSAPMDVTCNREKLQNMLSMKAGHLSYINKRLAEIEELRIKANKLIESTKQYETTKDSEKIEWWRKYTKKARESSVSSKISKKNSLEGKTLSEHKTLISDHNPRFPTISACTAKTLEDIRIKLFGTRRWDKTKRKGGKTDSLSDDLESVSMVYSEAKIKSAHRSTDLASKSKTIDNLKFMQELGDMTDERLINTIGYLGPTDEKTSKQEIPPKPYTCSSLTADPLAKMHIEAEINSKGRRIIERNFDRYEKKLKNPLKQDSSSILKINKDTGNLELPRLKLFKYDLPQEIKTYLAKKEARKAKMESVLPELASKFLKTVKRTKEPKLKNALRKYKSKKYTVSDQQKQNTS